MHTLVYLDALASSSSVTAAHCFGTHLCFCEPCACARENLLSKVVLNFTPTGSLNTISDNGQVPATDKQWVGTQA